MNINPITTSNGFGACFATLGKQNFTQAQKNLIYSVNRYLIKDENPTAGAKFDNVSDDIVILAKPEGKTGIFFQACCVGLEGEFYDKIGRGFNIVSTTTAETPKKAISNFNSLVRRLLQYDKKRIIKLLSFPEKSAKAKMDVQPDKEDIEVQIAGTWNA